MDFFLFSGVESDCHNIYSREEKTNTKIDELFASRFETRWATKMEYFRCPLSIQIILICHLSLYTRILFSKYSAQHYDEQLTYQWLLLMDDSHWYKLIANIDE